MTAARPGTRVCLFTGASGRLGTAFARRWAIEYDIAAVHHTRPLSVPTQDQWLVDPFDPGAEVADNAHPVFALSADLLDLDAVPHVVEQTLEQLGPIDLLVHAAAPAIGLEGWPQTPAQLAEPWLIEVVVAQHLVAEISARCWAGDPATNRRRNRNVVLLSSLAGRRAGAAAHPLRASVKAAAIHLTRQLAPSLDEIGIRANALAPNRFPEVVSTEQVADAIVQLDRATVTGGVLELDRAVPVQPRDITKPG